MDVAADVARAGVVSFLLPHKVRARNLVVARDGHRRLCRMAAQQIHYKDAPLRIHRLPRMPEIPLRTTPHLSRIAPSDAGTGREEARCDKW